MPEEYETRPEDIAANAEKIQENEGSDGVFFITAAALIAFMFGIYLVTRASLLESANDRVIIGAAGSSEKATRRPSDTPRDVAQRTSKQ